MPTIGITVSRDEGGADALLPGRPLVFTNEEYVQAVLLAGRSPSGGVRPVLLPHLAEGAPAEAARSGLLDLIDGLLVTGEARALPANVRAQPQLPTLFEQAPQRYRSDAAWIKGALARGTPVLGICRGAQMIGEVTGGSICLRLPDGEVRHSQALPGDQPAHRIRVEPGTRLQDIVGSTELEVNSFHLQAVEQPGPGFVVSARAGDGAVEAIESTRHPFVLGVQFHPERMVRVEALQRIFLALLAAADEYARRSRRKRFERRGKGNWTST